MDVFGFVFGQHFRQHPRDTDLSGNGFGSAAVVASDHHDFDAQDFAEL
jgi:hypothetical protein